MTHQADSTYSRARPKKDSRRCRARKSKLLQAKRRKKVFELRLVLRVFCAHVSLVSLGVFVQAQDEAITNLRADFEREAREIELKYERKMRALRDELDLRRKTEIHEIEERKNSQINTLMKNHERAFSDIKNYYNDITLNNLALINTLKVSVHIFPAKHFLPAVSFTEASSTQDAQRDTKEMGSVCVNGTVHTGRKQHQRVCISCVDEKSCCAIQPSTRPRSVSLVTQRNAA